MTLRVIDTEISLALLHMDVREKAFEKYWFLFKIIKRLVPCL